MLIHVIWPMAEIFLVHRHPGKDAEERGVVTEQADMTKSPTSSRSVYTYHRRECLKYRAGQCGSTFSQSSHKILMAMTGSTSATSWVQSVTFFTLL